MLAMAHDEPNRDETKRHSYICINHSMGSAAESKYRKDDEPDIHCEVDENKV